MKTIFYVIGLVSCWLIARAGDARAAAARSDSVIVIVRGVASDHERKIVDAALRSAVQGAGWTIVVPPAKSTAAVAVCVDTVGRTPWECVTAATKPGTGVFLVASVLRDKREDGAPMTRVMVNVVGYRPNIIDSQQFFCELCTDAKLRDGIGGLVRDVFKRVVISSGDTLLKVRSKADHATVVVDGEGFGEVNSVLAVVPGKHQVGITRGDVASPTQEVTIEEGAVVEVTIELPMAAEVKAPEKGHEADPVKHDGNSGSHSVTHAAPSRLWPGVLIGSGVTLLGVGAYDLWRGSTDSLKRYPRATAIGATSTALGVGLAVVGAVWWAKQSRGPAPTLSFGNGSAAVGIAGSF